MMSPDLTSKGLSHCIRTYMDGLNNIYLDHRVFDFTPFKAGTLEAEKFIEKTMLRMAQDVSEFRVDRMLKNLVQKPELYEIVVNAFLINCFEDGKHILYRELFPADYAKVEEQFGNDLFQFDRVIRRLANETFPCRIKR